METTIHVFPKTCTTLTSTNVPRTHVLNFLEPPGLRVYKCNTTPETLQVPPISAQEFLIMGIQ